MLAITERGCIVSLLKRKQGVVLLALLRKAGIKDPVTYFGQTKIRALKSCGLKTSTVISMAPTIINNGEFQVQLGQLIDKRDMREVRKAMMWIGHEAVTG